MLWNYLTIFLFIAIISIAIFVISKQYENFTGIGKVFSFHANPQPRCNPENNCFGGSYVKFGFGGNQNFKYDPRKRNFKMNLQ
tara:strand:+ start:111 stop:359 length:249 start_codon:yes stop_codon:yes gene_type:complete